MQRIAMFLAILGACASAATLRIPPEDLAALN